MDTNRKNSIYSHLSQRIFLFTFSFILFTGFSLASDGGNSDEKFKPGEVINHHIMDGYGWEIAHGFTLPLPIILYSSEKGFEIFSSANFYNDHHDLVAYNGYRIEHGHIISEDGLHVLDFSITKNVLFLFITAFLMVVIFTSVARGYKRNEGMAPRGIQSLFEPIILFVRDEIVKPNIGPKYERYLPYMLTLFFFIWFGNILGLLPAAANLTGNIAFTMTMALGTFLLTNFSGNKFYWKHVFWTPGVPVIMKFIIVPVEILGLFTKPFSLMVRLFVAITAGHIVVLALLSLTFIFKSYAVGIASAAVVMIINLIEILVATIQAYVFTMFSSLYIGMAIEEHHDEH